MNYPDDRKTYRLNTSCPQCSLMMWTGGVEEPVHCGSCGYKPIKDDWEEVLTTEEKYREFVLSKVSRQTKSDPIVAGALGLAGEAGEVADLIKKYTFHNHKLATEEVMEELGDLFFYFTLMMHTLETNLETIMEMNMEKLEARYPEGFKTERSMNRT